MTNLVTYFCDRLTELASYLGSYWPSSSSSEPTQNCAATVPKLNFYEFRGIETTHIDHFDVFIEEILFTSNENPGFSYVSLF